jgi:hypothetical protein
VEDIRVIYIQSDMNRVIQNNNGGLLFVHIKSTFVRTQLYCLLFAVSVIIFCPFTKVSVMNRGLNFMNVSDSNVLVGANTN